MIKISRGPRPPCLTPAFVAQETAKYISTDQTVWNVKELKEALLKFSSSKCAYCEVSLQIGPAYMEVEHFYAKAIHKNRVLDWDNLLPSCKRCNLAKGVWDVAIIGQDIIDPTLLSPRGHIRFDSAYRPVGTTPEGINTVFAIHLDDIDRLGVSRFKLGEKIKRKLEELDDVYRSLGPTATYQKKGATIRRIKNLLAKCRSDQPFSAVAATVLFRSAEYASMKASLEANGDWDPELDDLNSVVQASALV